jgi:uncharacterized membrane protein required for colicin V production
MVDAILVFFLFVLFMAGFARNTSRQLWSLGVLALSTYVSGAIYPSFVSLTGRFIETADGSKLASFALVFMACSALFNGPVDALIRYDRWRGSSTGAAFDDRLAGGILGVIEAIGSVEVAAAVLVAFPVLGWDGWIKSSSLIRTLINEAPFMIPLLPFDLHMVLKVFS